MACIWPCRVVYTDVACHVSITRGADLEIIGVAKMAAKRSPVGNRLARLRNRYALPPSRRIIGLTRRLYYKRR